MTSTSDDWLVHAEQATDGQEQRRCIAEAERLAAEDAFAWCKIAAAWSRIDCSSEARTALERALEHAGHQVWVHRNAAEVFRHALDDADSATRTLDAYESKLKNFAERTVDGLSAMVAPAYEWVLLAKGYRELQCGDDGALRCLQAQSRCRQRPRRALWHRLLGAALLRSGYSVRGGSEWAAPKNVC